MRVTKTIKQSLKFTVQKFVINAQTKRELSRKFSSVCCMNFDVFSIVFIICLLNDAPFQFCLKT